MLWRTTYTPEVTRNLEHGLPLSSPRAVIGVYSVAGLRELEIWWRLFEEDFSGEVTQFVLSNPGESDKWSSLLPQSRLDRTVLSSEIKPWLDITGQVENSRAFCTILTRERARIVVLGPPTEEVWEEVANIWREVRTSTGEG